MGLKSAIDRLKFDRRMVDWNIRHERLTKEELKTYLNSLVDLESRSEAFDLDDDSSADDLSVDEPILTHSHMGQSHN